MENLRRSSQDTYQTTATALTRSSSPDIVRLLPSTLVLWPTSSLALSDLPILQSSCPVSVIHAGLRIPDILKSFTLLYNHGLSKQHLAKLCRLFVPPAPEP
jgi:hypothetical protein